MNDVYDGMLEPFELSLESPSSSIVNPASVDDAFVRTCSVCDRMIEPFDSSEDTQVSSSDNHDDC